MFTRRASSALIMAAILLAASNAAQAQQPALQERFEKKVQEYEADDQKSPPPRGAILFAGDSQFYRWTTIHEDLPGHTLINRGIDSFQFRDLLRYFDRLVVPYQPRLIVLHVGGNDVHNGRKPAEVLADFQAFVARVRASLPGVHVVWSSITPGPGRWDEAPQRRETNLAIRKYVESQPDLGFVDLWDAMLTPDGQPREDLWVSDRVHPNHAGYLIRVKLTLPLLGPGVREKSEKK
jgi:lysophospholipase L1-like esterase